MKRKAKQKPNAKARPSKGKRLAAPTLELVLQKMATDHGDLVAMFNTNSKAFSDSLKCADAMLWMIRAAMDDMLNDRLETTVDGPVKRVNFALYARRFDALLKRMEIPQTPAPLNGDARPTIFGGTS